jgi:hypothetical protein
LSVVPTSVLIFVTPADADACPFAFSGGTPSAAEAELLRREAGGSLADWQWSYLARHRFIRFRRVWPEQYPVAVYARIPPWVGLGSLQVSMADSPVAMQEGHWSGEEYQVLGAMPPATTCVQLRGAVSRWIETWQVNVPQPLCTEYESPWSGTIRLPIRIVGDLHEAIQPLRGPAIDEAIRRALRLSASEVLRTCGNAPRIAELTAELDRSMSVELAELAFGFSIDVICEERTVETVRLDVPPPDAVVPRAIGADRHILHNVPVWVVAGGDRQGRWTLRVYGDAEMALRDWDKTKYWDGEFTVPLSEIVKR